MLSLYVDVPLCGLAQVGAGVAKVEPDGATHGEAKKCSPPPFLTPTHENVVSGVHAVAMGRWGQPSPSARSSNLDCESAHPIMIHKRNDFEVHQNMIIQ